jgi:cephalosporin-C deacetylase
MGIVEEQLSELRKYKPQLTRRPDFEAFWQMAVEEIFPSGQVSHALKLEDYNYPLPDVKVYKASIEAADGTILKGWYLCPSEAGNERKVPGLVRFHGYSSNKGKICELLLWALQGYAVLSMDVRGQCGDTPDGRIYTSGAFSGWMTLGLNSPMEYYYRQVYLDSVHMAEALARQPEVDETRIGLFGNSQGGALAVVSAALINQFAPKIPGITAKVAVVNAGIPFLSDMQRAYREHGDGPWAEFDWYFRMYDPFHKREDEIFECLSYFDVMNFAPWVRCPALVSVGLKDTACPPPTIFALFNHLAGEKKIIPYPDYGHESIDNHVDEQILFFTEKIFSVQR